MSPAATRMLTGFPRKSFCATPDAEWSVRRAERSPASCSRKEDPGGDGDGRDRRADQQGPVAPKGASFLPFDEKENLDPVSCRPEARLSTPPRSARLHAASDAGADRDGLCR